MRYKDFNYLKDPKRKYKWPGGKNATREKVRIRDNHTCQDCGKVWQKGQKRFDVHHLNGLCGKRSQNYDKISEIPNLITLCHKCHFNRPDHSTFSTRKSGAKDKMRLAEILERHAKGESCASIARFFLLSRQRIHQIVVNNSS